MVFENRVTSVRSSGLTTDVDFIDDAKGDACDNCVEVKVVMETVVDDTVVVEDPHVTLKFPYFPPEIQQTGEHIIF